MDQTITAVFESVDAASLAARRITSHFGRVKSIRMQHRRTDGGERRGLSDWIAVIPPGAAVNVQFSGGMYPGYADTGIAGTGRASTPISFYAEGGGFYGNESRPESEPQPLRERTVIRITADAGDAGRIAASLRSAGGWDVRTS